MIEDYQDIFISYLGKGGEVMIPIAIGSFVMWYVLGYRFLTMRRGSTHSVRELTELYMNGTDRKPKGLIDSAVKIGVDILRSTSKRRRKLMTEAFFPIRQVIRKYRSTAKVIVICAPLAGLLGTVGGMIEMFDLLHVGLLF